MADYRSIPTPKHLPVRLPRAFPRAGFCLSLLMSTAAAVTLAPHPAFARDGGSSGGGGSGGGSGGSGHDGGGSGSSGSGGGGGTSGGSAGGGSGNGGHGGGGSDSDGSHRGGSENSGRGGRDDRGESRDGRHDSRESRSGNDRRSDVVWSDRTGNTVELRYADGWSEAVRDSRYTLRDSSRRLVVDRPARRSDRARLEAELP